MASTLRRSLVALLLILLTATPVAAASFHSPAFAAGASIPRRFTCDGIDTSPPLAWSGLSGSVGGAGRARGRPGRQRASCTGSSRASRQAAPASPRAPATPATRRTTSRAGTASGTSAGTVPARHRARITTASRSTCRRLRWDSPATPPPRSCARRPRMRVRPRSASRPGTTAEPAGGSRMTVAAPRLVRAPRGTQLSCRGWDQEAALRMLMNNLDPEVAERPDDLVVYGGTGRAARSWEAFDAIVRELRRAGRRRDAAGPVGQAGGRLPHPRVGAARAHRQQQPGRALGDLGHVPGAGARRPDDVRADDRGLLDLHRHAGHPPGHLRDVRGAGAAALRRHAAGPGRADRRPRRHGRRAAAGRDHERGRLPVRRGRPRARAAAARTSATSTG